MRRAGGTWSYERGGGQQMDLGYKRVIIPVTGNAEDQKILALANELSAHRPMSITLVYVVEVPQALPLDADLPSEIDRGEQVLSNAEKMASHMIATGTQFITTDLLQARSAGSAIVDESIERGADAILMATRIRVVHGQPTAGQTATYVLRNAPCDVLLLRAAQDDLGNEGLPA